MSRYAEGMREAPSRKVWLAIIGLAVIAGLFCFAEPFAAAPAAKKKRATVAVTAAQRAAALKKVEANLEASANTALRQPGALAPVFEQLSRLSGGQSRDPVHILHFGDSHTAADEWTGALRDMFRQRFGDGGSGFSVA